MSKICVVGAGSWALALALTLNKNNNDVTIWSAVEEELNILEKERENKKYLQGIKIPERIKIEKDLEKALKYQDIIVFAVASPYVRKVARMVKEYIAFNPIIVNVAKGIEESTLMTLSEVIKDEIPSARVCVLSGPSHAEEVAMEIPTACVVGSKDNEIAKYLQKVFMNDYFRIYTSNDVVGIELGASLKNIIALAAGILDGLGCGDNTKAALITRGIHEITKLGIAMGGKIETFSGLTGIGDLIVTCTSMHSRNRKAGILIGQGKTYDEAMTEVKMVVEGVHSAKAPLLLSEKYKIEMPIVEEINKVLFSNKSAKDSLYDLMNRKEKNENQNLYL